MSSWSAEVGADSNRAIEDGGMLMEDEQDEAPVQLASHAAATIREMIVTGDLLPGQKIHQVDVARLLGVSRSPLREALRTLEGEGLVKYETNRGYVVTRLNMNQLAEIFQLRNVIEGELIAHIGTADETALEKLRTHLAEIEQAIDSRDFEALTAAVRQFRAVIYELSNLPIFLEELQRLWKRTDLYSAQHVLPPAQRVIRDHRAIIEAMEAGNLARVRKLLLGLRQLTDQVVVGLPRWR
jgi:DNA-binding GntR family transcriptional regulator